MSLVRRPPAPAQPARRLATRRLWPQGPPVLALLAIAGCTETATQPRVDPIDGLSRPLSAAEAALVDAGNGFAFDLVRTIAASKADSNVVLSPLSASMALGMTLNGANGETFDAMRRTLGFVDLDRSAVNESYRGLIDLLVDLDPSVELAIANSIWYRQGWTFEEAFLSDARTWFDARVEALDFASPSAVTTINGWVEQATNGRIPTLLDTIDGAEVMFLVNAIYFKAPWVERFDPAKTRDAPFHLADGSQKTVRMMNRNGSLRSLGAEDATVLDLPYGGGAYSMTILLPHPDRSLAEVVAGLDPATWSEWSEQFDGMGEGSRGELFMPRFRLEFAVSLKDALSTLGMGIAFDDQRADFTRLHAAGGLYITRVQQNAFIEVNEEGTEAAAATAVGIGVTSAPAAISLDRPFAFAIRERFSGAILFIGQVTDPAPE